MASTDHQRWNTFAWRCAYAVPSSAGMPRFRKERHMGTLLFRHPASTRTKVLALAVAVALPHGCADERGRGDGTSGIRRKRRCHRPREPDGHGVRARWTPLRRRAGRQPPGHQERLAPRDAVPHRDRQLVGRARPARRCVRSELRDQPVRLRLLHGHDAQRPQPRQPLHRQRRRRRRRQRSRHPRPRTRSRARRITTAARSTSASTASSTSRSARTRTASNAQTLSNLLGKILRINADGTIPTDNPFYAHRDRRQPRDLGAGPPQPVHLLDPARHRPDLHQRRRAEHLGGDRRRRRGRELRLARHRGHHDRPAIPCADLRLRPRRDGAKRLRDHRRRLLQPDEAPNSRPRTSATTSSPTTAAAGSTTLDTVQQHRRPVRHRHLGASRPEGLRRRGALLPGARQRQQHGHRVLGSPTRARPPTITTQPANQTVAAGQPATFSRRRVGRIAALATSGSATAPTSPGATSSSYTLASAQTSDNGARFRVIVTNRLRHRDQQRGGLDRLLEPGAHRHDHPADRRHALQRRQTITFAGTGTDPQDGTLPAVGIHLGGRSSITTPTRIPSCSRRAASPAGPSSSRRRARRRPMSGTGSTSRSGTRRPDPHHVPRRAPARRPAHGCHEPARPPGADRWPAVLATPTSFDARGRHAADDRGGHPADLGRTNYVFQGWSDGGAALHTISTPSTNTTYTGELSPVQTGGGRRTRRRSTTTTRTSLARPFRAWIRPSTSTGVRCPGSRDRLPTRSASDGPGRSRPSSRRRTGSIPRATTASGCGSTASSSSTTGPTMR